MQKKVPKETEDLLRQKLADARLLASMVNVTGKHYVAMHPAGGVWGPWNTEEALDAAMQEAGITQYTAVRITLPTCEGAEEEKEEQEVGRDGPASQPLRLAKRQEVMLKDLLHLLSPGTCNGTHKEQASYAKGVLVGAVSVVTALLTLREGSKYITTDFATAMDLVQRLAPPVVIKGCCPPAWRELFRMPPESEEDPACDYVRRLLPPGEIDGTSL